jgi:hypothetical protein
MVFLLADQDSSYDPHDANDQGPACVLDRKRSCSSLGVRIGLCLSQRPRALPCSRSPLRDYFAASRGYRLEGESYERELQPVDNSAYA